jgi:hypothetical protein
MPEWLFERPDIGNYQAHRYDGHLLLLGAGLGGNRHSNMSSPALVTKRA